MSLVATDSPFFMFGALPLHTLVVHFAVVLLPLSALALIAIILVPRWRGAFVWATMAGLVIGTGAAFVSKESGEQLAARIGEPQLHAKWGDILPLVALLLLASALLWLWLQRRSSRSGQTPGSAIGSGPQLAVGIIAIGLAVISIGMTIVVGHTGASAVWSSRSLDSEAQEDAVPPTPPPTPSTSAAPSDSANSGSATGYTLADVAAHATPADCWTSVSGQVYDLTTWIAQHPGGAGVIEGMCGIDATAAFEAQHQGQGEPTDALAGFLLGPLAAGSVASAPASTAPASNAPAGTAPAVSAAPSAYSLSDVAAHATPTDCWTAVAGTVYDLTQWIDQHPGGSGVIEGMCGIDATAAFEAQHQGQGEPNDALAAYAIGPLG